MEQDEKQQERAMNWQERDGEGKGSSCNELTKGSENSASLANQGTDSHIKVRTL